MVKYLLQIILVVDYDTYYFKSDRDYFVDSPLVDSINIVFSSFCSDKIPV